MPHHASLSFTLHACPLPEMGSIPSRELLTLLPVINGKPLFGDSVPHVDTLEVLVAGEHPGDIELCTCTCGVAECAGFWEPVQVRMTKDCVTWHIPAEGYARLVAQSHFGAGPWTFEFKREAYFKALAQAEQQCVAAQAATPSAVFAPAPEFADDEPVRPPASLASILAVCRPAKALDVAVRQTMARAAGPLMAKVLHLTVGSNTWKVYPESVMAAYARMRGLPARAKDQQALSQYKQVWKQAAAEFQQNPVQALLGLPEPLFPTGFPVQTEDFSEMLEREQLQAAQAQVQVEWVPAG